MFEDIDKINQEVEKFQSNSPEEIEQFRIAYLGKKGKVTLLFSAFKEVPVDQKKEFGKQLNILKREDEFDIDYYSEKFLLECLRLESQFSGIIASKRMAKSEDGRRLIRKLATGFFVIILKILFGTNLSDTHGMKGVKKASVDRFIQKVVSTQDLFDTELLIRIEKSGQEFKEVPAKINEIRPSVSLIYKRIPRTIRSLLNLRLVLYRESLNTKNL